MSSINVPKNNREIEIISAEGNAVDVRGTSFSSFLGNKKSLHYSNGYDSKPLHSHLDFYSENLGDVSGEYGKCIHKDILGIENGKRRDGTILRKGLNKERSVGAAAHEECGEECGESLLTARAPFYCLAEARVATRRQGYEEGHCSSSSPSHDRPTSQAAPIDSNVGSVF
ncbi:hypothetical protein Trydic_g11305 [Trypoxylus dichotomus]